MQGNVNGLIDENGNIVAEYAYDVWGKLISATATSETHTEAMNANPVRYRGYSYDSDTGLYYLQSRYYDSNTGRFLNADNVMFIGATGTVLSANIFTYCENDVVNKVDDNGMFGTPIQWAMAAIGGDCGGDFVYGGKMNDAAQAFGTYIKSFFTNNVSRMAKHKSKNIVGKTISRLSKSYLVGTCESLCVSTASDFSSCYLNLGLNYYLGR